MIVREQNWYGAWKREEECRCGRLGLWKAIDDDGRVEFFCDDHAPKENRVYTQRCSVPGCIDENGEPSRSQWLDRDGKWRCEAHHIEQEVSQ